MAFSPHDPLFQLALVLVAGIVGGELFSLVRLPKVTGWIATGILLRATSEWHGPATGLSANTTADFRPYMSFVLGYIAFTVGAALHFASLRNAESRLGLLLLGEALVTPSVVVAILMLIGPLVAPGVITMPVAALLGAVAIAGAPGTTVLVIQEARARGILTRTLLAAVALIDMVAVGVFVFTAYYLAEAGTGLAGAAAELGNAGAGLAEAGSSPAEAAAGGGGWRTAGPVATASVAREFGVTMGVGALSAVIALGLIRTVVSPAFLGATMVAVILGAWGAATGLNASGILACTFAGIFVSNLRHDTVRSTEAYLHSIGAVLFAAFYTLAGMNLNLLMVVRVAGLVALYFLARFAGKYAGAYLAMSLAGAPTRIRDYLGMSLIPHGGVAVGLLLLVQDDPRLAGVAETVTTIGLAALVINQLVGPSGLRYALGRAGEVGKGAPRLLDFLDEHHIAVGLVGSTKEEVIRTLTERLYSLPDRPSVPQEEFVDRVLQREAQASTCLAEGFMIPHAILDAGQEITGVLGVSSRGLDLAAPDGQPVHAVLLLATPTADRKRHLEVLAAFARAITQDVNLREQLYHARNAAHAYDVLHAEQNEEINYFLEDAMTRAKAETPA